MGSHLRQLRLLKVAVILAATAGAAVLVSSALGSSFPGVNGKLAYVVNDGNGKPSYIVTASEDAPDPVTGVAKISTPNAKTDQGDLQPRFSADGTEVVFTRNASKVGYDDLQIWIAAANVDPKSKVKTVERQIKITGLPDKTFADTPTFTPDGKKIVFMIDTINAPVGLGIVSVNGGKAKQITHGNDWQPAVSPDGTQIAYIHNFDIVVADFDSTAETVTNPSTIYTEPQSASSMDTPDWSPDGQEIAFDELDKSSLIWDIWTIASDGSDSGVATNLTNGTTASSMDPAYSPDGTEIAFDSSDNSTGAGSIDVMDADGNNVSTAVAAPDSGFVYSPDWGVATSPVVYKHHHKKHHHKHHHKKKKKK